ncbi:hypothetical protein SELMODRAFT_426481 [Selaginella moellendorffii]|uniref:HAT C-terminal dimerisation domain-containing protein n=1 Tax=Selaginella moellendorffii TaxID=88036 RepID=D8SWH9_SELML|nr:hypothetical protein SELMODRAFT_426481 [Selaginella moellendorffii]
MDVTSVAPLCKATMAKIQLDSRGYPIIPDDGRCNGPLDELRSSVKGNEYRDVEMIRSIHGEDLEEVLEFQKNFGTSLLEGIRTRLQDSEATGILSKFHFLAPINLPSSVRELKAFGMINEAELAEEYSLWKIIASVEWKGKTFMDVWGMIYAHSIWTKKYPNLLKLAMVGMVQCCNTASCERGFSRINLVKNKFRNQMGTEMVDELVRISIEGPPIAEFDFETVEFIRMRFPLLRIMPYTKNSLLHTAPMAFSYTSSIVRSTLLGSARNGRSMSTAEDHPWPSVAKFLESFACSTQRHLTPSSRGVHPPRLGQLGSYSVLNGSITGGGVDVLDFLSSLPSKKIMELRSSVVSRLIYRMSGGEE